MYLRIVDQQLRKMRREYKNKDLNIKGAFDSDIKTLTPII